jgi:hypothetical protein
MERFRKKEFAGECGGMAQGVVGGNVIVGTFRIFEKYRIMNIECRIMKGGGGEVGPFRRIWGN